MKLLNLLVLFSLIAFVGCNKGGGNVEPKNDDEKAFYALGAMLGGRFKDLDLNENELALVSSGLKSAAKGEKKIDPTEHQKKIQEIFNGRIKKKVVKEKESGTAFIEKFLKEEGAKKTASGLAYKVLKEGKGKKPKASDEVEVHYHGTLTDGTVFDSSVERGKTVKFPLGRVIKGWTEGLQLVGEGGKIKLVIPSDLGYEDRGAPPKIPGGATLVFEVELFKVAKGKANPHAGLKGKGKKAKKKK
jgi:FKBP-type peptidyl-prolyl cis-trans isomerase FkpA